MQKTIFPTVLVSLALLTLSGCEDAPVRRQGNLPPSASDLPLLKTTKLCDAEQVFTVMHKAEEPKREPWGAGSEYRIPADRSAIKSNESYFFDQDGTMVGALFVFPDGLDLKPYPVLQDTIRQLPPALQFYLNVANVVTQSNLETSTLYKTGDEKSTTEYLMLGKGDHPVLLMASIAVDPYDPLLSPYRKEFLARVTASGGLTAGKADVKGSEDKEPFPMLQQFSRGETALLGYCGSKKEEVAVDAYRKAVGMGITNKARLADTHHKLGLALKASGNLEEARKELEQSLTIRPNVKEVYNNLGTIYKELKQKQKATAAFEKAVTLSPNYPVARFNLAEMYEESNPKLAISEYETYIALGEGILEEEPRVEEAKKRVTKLKGH